MSIWPELISDTVQSAYWQVILVRSYAHLFERFSGLGFVTIALFHCA